jgi:hypothetical protein
LENAVHTGLAEPSTTPVSVRAELVEAGTDAPPFQSLPFDKLRANGLERCFPIRILRQAQDGEGQRDWEGGLRKPKEVKDSLRVLFLSSILFFASVVSVLKTRLH